MNGMFSKFSLIENFYGSDKSLLKGCVEYFESGRQEWHPYIQVL